MTRTQRLILVLAAGVTASCGTESETTRDSAGNSDVYIELLSEPLFFEKSSGNCESDTSSTCTTVTITYPYFSGTLNPDVEQTVNNKVTSLLVDNMLYDSLSYGDYEAFANAFINEYNELQEEFGEAFGWQYDGDVSILRNDSAVLSLKADTYVYTGGAHGISLVRYLNINPATGQTYSMQDIFQGPYQEVLNKKVRKAFMDRKGFDSEEELSDQGYSFKEGQFFTDNFGVLPDSIVFYFNQYEVASYAKGPSRLAIPLASLDSVLRVNFKK